MKSNTLLLICGALVMIISMFENNLSGIKHTMVGMFFIWVAFYTVK